MAHSMSNFIFTKENVNNYKKRVSDQVKKATSALDESKNLLVMDYGENYSLRQISSWLKSKTSSIINTLVGFQETDLSVEYTNAMDDQSDCVEQELLLQRFFPSTVDRMDKQLKEVEEEARYCRDELNIVYLAVLELNTTVYEDVFDGPDFVRDKSEEKIEVDPVMKLADDASKQDIDHYKKDAIGQIYFLSSIHFVGPSKCFTIRDSLEVSVDNDSFVKVDVCIDLELDVTIAGDDVLNKLGVSENNLNVCKDDLKISDDGDAEVIGEKLFLVQRGLRRVPTRIVFVRHITGMHIAWFTAIILGSINI